MFSGRRVLPVLFALTVACGAASTSVRFPTARIIDGRRVVGDFVGPFAYEHFLRGMLALDDGRPQEAVDHLQLAINSDPDSAYLYCVLARAQGARGRLDAAQRSIQRARGIDERLELVHVVQGEIAELRGDISVALESFERAVEVEPTEEEPSKALGGFLQRRGEQAEAVREYRRLLARSPASVGVRRRLGMLLLDLGQLGPGIVELEAVARASGAEREAMMALAQAQLRSGNLPRAAELYRAVLASDRGQTARRGLIEALLRMQALDLAAEEIERYRPTGDPAAAALDRAELLLRAHRCVQAAAQADLALGIRPDVTEARLALGQALDCSGQRAEAMRALAAIPPGTQAFPEARSTMAAILVRIGEREGARSLLEDSLRLSPLAEPLCVGLSDLQLDADDLRGAEATLRPCLTPGAGVALAALLVVQSRVQEAQALLVSILRRSPGNGPASRLMARLELEQPAPDRAAARLRAHLGRDPADARAVSLLGVVLARQGRFGDARARAARALRLEPVDAEVLANAAEVDELRGERFAALSGYRKALRFGPDRALRARLHARIRRFAGPGH